MEQKKRKWWVYPVIFLVSQLVAGLLPVVLSKTGMQQNVFGGAITLALLVANVLALCLFFCYRPQSITRTSTMAGLKGRGARRTVLAFLLALPLIFLVNIVQEAFFPNITDLVGDEMMKDIMFNPLGLLTVAVLGPVCEELLFRGGVQTCMLRQYPSQGPGMAIAFTAVIFSLIHLNPAQMPAAFTLGLALGFAYWWTGSLIAPMAIHVFNNSFACVVAQLSPDEDSIIQFLGGSLSAGIVSIVSLFFLMIVIRAVRKEGLEEEQKG